MLPTTLVQSAPNRETNQPREEHGMLYNRAVQNLKITCWGITAITSAYVLPASFTKGAILGTSLFMGVHEFIQREGPFCESALYKAFINSRTWKHIVTGAAISGLGWGLGGLFSANNELLMASLFSLQGSFLSIEAAYSNALFAGKNSEVNQQDLVIYRV